MDVSPELIAAFFAGVTSVLTGMGALHYERKRGRKDCEERIAALHEGMHFRDEVEERRERRGA